jgi:hypothetical protein
VKGTVGPTTQRIPCKEPHRHGYNGPTFKKERNVPPQNGKSIKDHGNCNENLVTTGVNLIKKIDSVNTTERTVGR